jgi:hypothetical protein
MEMENFPFHVLFNIFFFINNMKDRIALAICSKNLYQCYKTNKRVLSWIEEFIKFGEVARLMEEIPDENYVTSYETHCLDKAIRTRYSIVKGNGDFNTNILKHMLASALYGLYESRGQKCFSIKVPDWIDDRKINAYGRPIYGTIYTHGKISGDLERGFNIVVRSHYTKQIETEKTVSTWKDGKKTGSKTIKVFRSVCVLKLDIKTSVSPEIAEVIRRFDVHHYFRR